VESVGIRKWSAAAIWGAWALLFASISGAAPPGERLPTLVHLAPGLAVGDGPPPGWSHLVVKAVPRLASGDLDTLPGSARATATTFRTVIAADVRRSGPGGSFVLARVGLAIAVPGPTPGVDLAVGAGGAGADLGAVDRLVLVRALAELDRGRLVARTPTFGLLRTPVVRLEGGRHRAAWLCYAIAVAADTGELRAFVWWDGRDPGASITALAPSTVFDCALDVQAGRILGSSLAVSWSFAMAAAPPGRARSVPPDLADLVSACSRGGAAPAELERALAGR